MVFVKNPENKCNCPEDCGGEICGNGICGEREANLEQWLTCSGEDMAYCRYNLCDEDCAEKETPALELVEYEKAISNLESSWEFDKVEKANLKSLDNEPIYSITSAKKGKLFFIIPINVKVNSEINAQTGEVNNIQKPWWSFLVKF